jgi:hypothetical protein
MKKEQIKDQDSLQTSETAWHAQKRFLQNPWRWHLYFLSSLGSFGSYRNCLLNKPGVYQKIIMHFLRIAEDGTVTCFTGKIEMGQGIITSCPR